MVTLGLCFRNKQKNTSVHFEVTLMENIIITSGSRYVDIDALACSISLASLFNLMGQPVIAVHTCPLNNTISNFYKDKAAKLFSKQAENKLNSRYIIVDVSTLCILSALYLKKI